MRLQDGIPNASYAVAEYVKKWSTRGYSDDISDEVPVGIDDIAPSYKAIACALLKNDICLASLGMPAPWSEWYSTLKAIELNAGKPRQLTFQFRVATP